MERRNESVYRSSLRHLSDVPNYIAGESYNWAWSNNEIGSAIKLWNIGLHIKPAAETLDREEIELMVLWNDLLIGSRIKQRQGGIYGSTMEHEEKVIKRSWNSGPKARRIYALNQQKTYDSAEEVAKDLFPHLNHVYAKDQIHKSCRQTKAFNGYQFQYTS